MTLGNASAHRWPSTCCALTLVCIAACSATDGKPLVVGHDGVGGTPSGSGGYGGSGAILIGDGGASEALAVHIEQNGEVVTLITLGCAEECADVAAVASGGYVPYDFVWEDGSTNPARRVCPSATTAYTVTVTDSGSSTGEFERPPISANAMLTAEVSSCPPDAGQDAGQDARPVNTEVYWADWTTVTVGTPGAAEGTLSPAGGDVRVSHAGEVLSYSAPHNGTNNFLPAATYLSATVSNAPSNGGMIALAGGASLTQEITFSVPVRDPLIAVWSVGFGSLGLPMTWEFDVAPTLLSSGVNSSWPLPSTLTVSGLEMSGVEGNGVVQFTGVFTSISFTLPVPEPMPGYAGFTVGIRGRA